MEELILSHISLPSPIIRIVMRYHEVSLQSYGIKFSDEKSMRNGIRAMFKFRLSSVHRYKFLIEGDISEELWDKIISSVKRRGPEFLSYEIKNVKVTHELRRGEVAFQMNIQDPAMEDYRFRRSFSSKCEKAHTQKGHVGSSEYVPEDLTFKTNPITEKLGLSSEKLLPTTTLEGDFSMVDVEHIITTCLH